MAKQKTPYTPGPWRPRSSTFGDHGQILDAGGHVVATFRRGPRQEANMRLAGRAAGLLEMCQEALEWIDSRTTGIALDVKDSLRAEISLALPPKKKG